MSLGNKVEELKQKNRAAAASKLVEVESKCRDFRVSIQNIQTGMNAKRFEIASRLNEVQLSLENERQSRNALDEAKTGNGNGIGRKFCESLSQIEGRILSKCEGLKTQTEDHNETLVALNDAFGAKYRDLMKDNPDVYLRGAEEYGRVFTGVKGNLEGTLNERENLIREGFVAVDQTRIASIDALDAYLKERKDAIEGYLTYTKAMMDEKAAEMHAFLQTTFQNLGLAEDQ